VEIDFRAHDGAGLEFFKRTFGVAESDLVYSDGKGAGDEMLTLLTHSGTHVDAPFHYGPISEGAPAATIDELPLEWFFRGRRRARPAPQAAGRVLEITDLEAAIEAIGYTLAPRDIVLLQTGCDRKLHTGDYFEQPGMGRESTLWLVEQGIRVIGIDAFGFDRPFSAMTEGLPQNRRRALHLAGPLRRDHPLVLARSRSSPTSTRSDGRTASRWPRSR